MRKSGSETLSKLSLTPRILPQYSCLTARRINAGLVSIALLAVAAYAFSIGWIGMRSWAL
jgi:hypothetical protein